MVIKEETSNYQDIKSIGCYYCFDKSSIVTVEAKEEKYLVRGSSYTKCSISEIANKLRSYCFSSKIWINKHESLNECFHGKLNQVDFYDESSKSELMDIYDSLVKEQVLIFEEGFDVTKKAELQAVCLALKGLKHFKPKNYLLVS